MKFHLIALACAFMLLSSFKPPPDDGEDNARSKMDFLMDYISIRFSEHKIDHFIYVEAKRQRIHIIKDRVAIATYPISTGKNGTGPTFGSGMTPTGLHRVKGMLGSDAPLGGIIKGRHYTGEQAEIIAEPRSVDTDDVTTRAIRLEGLEPGINKGGDKDTYERHIYIHGTPEEGLIGTPASHGCVRMKNKDIVDFFEKVEDGMYVVILNM